MFYFRRSFSVDAAVLAPDHPYAVNASSNSCTIHFYEFRGIGPPSTEFGHGGDVYIDTNPQLRALHWRERGGVRGAGAGPWRRWTALLLDKVPLHRYLVAHPWARSPEGSDLYLWVDPAGVTWTSKDELCASRVQMIRRNIAKFIPGSTPNVDALVSEVLARMLEREKKAVNGAGSQPNYPPTLNPMHRLPLGGDSSQTGSSSESSQHGSPLRPPAGQYSRPQTRPPSHTSPNEFRSGGPVGVGMPSDTYARSIVPGSAVSPPVQPPSAHDILRVEIALDKMRRAQSAELKSKQELKQKTRELAQLRNKEKEVIGMSYTYQKREQDLVAALAAAQQRSSAELEQMRAGERLLSTG
ncbi:hypothetical protein DFH09DRAFT_256389 [Mycena vulgaris]|nr:hypothetical protein DFH09DRAFT_256389 [Mycena vulgaris]